MPFQLDMTSVSIGILIALLLVYALQFFFYLRQKTKLREKEKAMRGKIENMADEIKARKEKLNEVLKKMAEGKQ